MTYSAKIDGILAGAEVQGTRYVLSLLKELELRPETVKGAFSQLDGALRSFTGVTLSPQDTKDLYTSIQNLGPKEKELQDRYPKFMAHFNRFREELEFAVVADKGLELRWGSIHSQPPPSNYNQDPSLLKMLRRFGVREDIRPEKIRGHVLSFHDAGGTELVVLYSDQHTAENQRDFSFAVMDFWMPHGFNFLGVENLSRETGEWDNSKVGHAPVATRPLLARCPGDTKDEKKKLVEAITGSSPYNAYSYVALECVFSGALATFGIDDTSLSNRVDRMSPQRVVLPAGVYKFYDAIVAVHIERSHVMVRNFLELMHGANAQDKKYNKTLFWVGGMHASDIKEHLKNNSISYVEILVQSADFNLLNDLLKLEPAYGPPYLRIVK
ncbi:MAG: hypothetical protein A2W61_04305 [Deltaproteobacteria bacterium RIFCSPLOWO2_01_44_7]|nr:MAG: hypothetical protein A2712_03440 [Deltaproteobacteria bacterium RIFCSPHIGHO2_01_FULL_43_49]OGQ16246.1 MAG: hypothetical protein A3D22_01410 [Deltaproteobacteria bacterium RIFCSPHIGHO2_02_FULL_44_53]OGQ29206.1 MAG: hypothetical protein A3D98_05195 [Deltaproteobacteria bacterium RIFCSPHIGHO2_12_FULL_44_21]OGQ32763.1 MAG: hypothetical protein A2979_09340 [Deltaproteobacteria bacterium RIFCSPLOWO2_01_FULL_45_74]OGQ41865.1 MAG: hypothetical protein A3I70_09125 [Deltaproteobacteria bacterium 